MKVLLTGATSSQVAVKRGTNTFAGLINKALTDGGHDVTWIEPSVSLSKDYLDEFDSVIVGLAPPTSTAAHRIYGALSVAQYAYELGTLKIMLDAPNPKRVWAGIRAIYNKPQDLAKDFYYKRREYQKAVQNESLERLILAIETLYTKEWPVTVFPAFPWMSFPSVSTEIPMTSAGNLVGLNLDSDLLQHSNEIVPISSEYWVADFLNTAWTKMTEKTVSLRVEPVRQSKWEKDAETYERVRGAVGCLISTHHKGTPWWSVSLSQALSCGIPVCTDWRLSSMLGPDWSNLPHAIEDMNQYDRASLALSQKEEYLASIMDWQKSVEFACNSLLRK